jgi:hypothetical protein
MRIGRMLRGLVVVLALGSVAWGASGKPLNVLLVSAYWGNEAAGIKWLLEQHGVRVTVTGWAHASARRAKAFDLVIIGGPGRLMHDGIVRDYEGAVLGLGSYGSAYFGKLKLKGGLPHT